MPTKARKTTTKKVAPVVEPEELELDEVEEEELEELDETEVAEAAPKKKSGGEEVTFGASDLAALLSKKLGKTITARELRTQLRRMARDGRLDREIIPGNRARYNWSGPNDPEVKAIIRAVQGGEIEVAKKEALAKLKEQKAAKDAKKKAKKAKVKAVEEEELEELED
jgi:DNA-binding HxlR family transcriptional regulator